MTVSDIHLLDIQIFANLDWKKPLLVIGRIVRWDITLATLDSTYGAVLRGSIRMKR